MKKLTLAAISAAFIFLVSCKQTTNSSNALIGQWKIDSIATPDSNLIGVMLLASTLYDTAVYDVSFTKDTITLHQKDSVTKSGYTFDSKNKQLLLKEDSSVLSYQPIDSSYIKLIAKDSTIIFLRKQ
ncbi:hypothetical protein [Flavisolibacter tropicus]|uniref:Lipocalin-like domain-containing protein n=1 Tax=Flavisolibacter tropicus TaxID=1492898 RepID=A0A172TS51_9BACT|nr:hypothetical protein [Flavisolibacter tropicus]ANE49593.1 hypothetical protein SY85_02815 [Flavisolibacter tropicus]